MASTASTKLQLMLLVALLDIIPLMVFLALAGIKTEVVVFDGKHLADMIQLDEWGPFQGGLTLKWLSYQI